MVVRHVRLIVHIITLDTRATVMVHRCAGNHMRDKEPLVFDSGSLLHDRRHREFDMFQYHINEMMKDWLGHPQWPMSRVLRNHSLWRFQPTVTSPRESKMRQRYREAHSQSLAQRAAGLQGLQPVHTRETGTKSVQGT